MGCASIKNVSENRPIKMIVQNSFNNKKKVNESSRQDDSTLAGIPNVPTASFINKNNKIYPDEPEERKESLKYKNSSVSTPNFIPINNPIPLLHEETKSYVEPKSFIEPKSFVEPKPFVQSNPSVQPKPFVQPKPSVQPKPFVQPKPSVQPKQFANVKSSVIPKPYVKQVQNPNLENSLILSAVGLKCMLNDCKPKSKFRAIYCKNNHLVCRY